MQPTDKDNNVENFVEKPDGITHGLTVVFVCSPNIENYIEGDSTVWEKEPLQNIVRKKN